MFLANHSIFYIIITFLLAYFAIIILKAIALYIVNFDMNIIKPDLYKEIFLQSAIYVLGGDASAEFNRLHYVHYFKLASKIIALIVPTLLLGALVYKVTKPQASLIIFSNNMALDPNTCTLETCYYLATKSDVFDLKTKTVAKYYKPVLDNGDRHAYPLKLIELDERTLPKPFSFVPTRVTVPIDIRADPTDEANNQIGVILDGNSVQEFYIDGESISAVNNEFCQIIVIVEAIIPDLQTTLVECKIFNVHCDLEVKPAPVFDTEFDPHKNKYIIKNWEAFDSV